MLSLERKDKVVLSRKSKLTLDRPVSSSYLDIGTMAFMKWLSSTEENKSAGSPIIVKYMLKDKYIIFYDGDLLKM